ncbi:hypothetical protein ACFVRB_33915 [Streptomyces nojiriensis]|uniref:hypothetical protein n=1 Tax=Streptomyces nojiriensis TaxID=66374 RepID=UPI0036DF5E48
MDGHGVGRHGRTSPQGRRIYRAGSHEQTSDYAVPFWRVNVFVSLLAARFGDETTAVAAHLETHRGLMLARSGDLAASTGHARAALDALPPEKHSLTLRLLMKEVEQS